ncbi:hypothetical protein PcaKH35_04710 [Parageobacillus caldoxylosilyticus]|nr:hypothetical protein [Parageobacillus caldoxylosilyticus]BDG42126.1 hypothetical protein PcaKH35_04710 [Parageobacillus caldoxylosilyticus]
MHPEGKGYLTPSGGEPELDSAKSGGAWLLPSRRLSSFEGMKTS